MNSVSSVLVLVAMAATNGAAVAQSPSATEQALRDIFTQQFISYWQAGDPEGLAGLWHEDGDWMSIVRRGNQ